HPFLRGVWLGIGYGLERFLDAHLHRHRRLHFSDHLLRDDRHLCWSRNHAVFDLEESDALWIGARLDDYSSKRVDGAHQFWKALTRGLQFLELRMCCCSRLKFKFLAGFITSARDFVHQRLAASGEEVLNSCDLF